MVRIFFERKVFYIIWEHPKEIITSNKNKKKNISLGFPKGNPLWSLPGKVGGLGEGKTTHRKSSVFLPPNSLPAFQS